MCVCVVGGGGGGERKQAWGWKQVVSFAAVIRVASPLTAVSGEERCVTTLITAAKETRKQGASRRFLGVSRLSLRAFLVVKKRN